MMSPPHLAPALPASAARLSPPVVISRTGVAPPVATGVEAIEHLPAQEFSEPIFETPGFFEPFFLSAPFPGGFGLLSRSDGLPLGWGLWPACDSSASPGVFWTVGPCFGIGSYSEELAPVVSIEYPLGVTPPSGYLLPPIFLATQAPPSAAAGPTRTAAPPPTMLLYLTNAQTIAVSDWWVAHGRLQYVAASGAPGVIDLSQLDLEGTIKQNEARGLEFHLKFTPPSDRP